MKLYLTLFTILFTIALSTTICGANNLNAKDIHFKVRDGCTIKFKPKLLPSSYTEINTNITKQALSTDCKHLTLDQKKNLQMQSEIYVTKITSDLQDTVAICSIPRRVLNDTSLTYESIKLSLDPKTLDLIGCNYQIRKPITSDFNPAENNVFVSIDIAYIAQKPIIAPPKQEQEEKEEANQSFFRKYWYYFLPLALITLLNVFVPQMSEEAGQAGQAAGGARRPAK